MHFASPRDEKSGLASLKTRLALFEERLRTFPKVFRNDTLFLLDALVIERLGRRIRCAEVECPLDAGVGQRRAGCQARRPGVNGCAELVGRDDLLTKPNPWAFSAPKTSPVTISS